MSTGITDLRCDGLVEVCYELNNIKLWGKSNGGGANFDIKVNFHQAEHNHVVFEFDEWKKHLAPSVQCGHESTYRNVFWKTTFGVQELCVPIGHSGGNN